MIIQKDNFLRCHRPGSLPVLPISPGQKPLKYSFLNKETVSLVFAFCIIISLFMVCLLVGTVSAATTWCNNDYDKKAPILINNTGGSAQTYYQVELNYTYDSDMNSNFSDIRVYNESDCSLIPLWNESAVDGSWNKIWFNATYLAANSWTNDTYYLYYKNPSASSASNGTNTFEFFDDFEGTSLDTTTKWNQVGTVNVSNSYAITSENLDVNYYYSKDTYLGSYALEWKLESEGAYGRYGFTKDGTVLLNTGEMIGMQNDGGTGLYTDFGNTSHLQNDDGNTDAAQHRFRMEWTSISAEIFYDGSSLRKVVDSQYIPDEAMCIKGANYLKVDWVALRKYASPEPTAQLGAEEGWVYTPEWYYLNYIDPPLPAEWIECGETWIKWTWNFTNATVWIDGHLVLNDTDLGVYLLHGVKADERHHIDIFDSVNETMWYSDATTTHSFVFDSLVILLIIGCCLLGRVSAIFPIIGVVPAVGLLLTVINDCKPGWLLIFVGFLMVVCVLVGGEDLLRLRRRLK